MPASEAYGFGNLLNVSVPLFPRTIEPIETPGTTRGTILPMGLPAQTEAATIVISQKDMNLILMIAETLIILGKQTFGQGSAEKLLECGHFQGGNRVP